MFINLHSKYSYLLKKGIKFSLIEPKPFVTDPTHFRKIELENEPSKKNNGYRDRLTDKTLHTNTNTRTRPEEATLSRIVI